MVGLCGRFQLRSKGNYLITSNKRIIPEMLLAFILAITTGARMQTVFTLRANSFLSPLRPSEKFKLVTVGGTSLVNSKKDVEYVLVIPKWLHRKVRQYLKSERYRRRVGKNVDQKIDAETQYVFLSKFGNPYYVAKQDTLGRSYKNPPRGNSVRQFIRSALLPKLSFDFTFHDLRATFGVNLVSSMFDGVKGGLAISESNTEFLRILEFARSRMGHKDSHTTMKYMRFRSNQSVYLDLQNDYENFLKF